MADERTKKQFRPEILWSSVIAIPLQKEIDQTPEQQRHVVIDLNLDCRGGRDNAKEKVRQIIVDIGAHYDEAKNKISDQYVFAQLTGTEIRELVRRDQTQEMPGVSRVSPTAPGPGATDDKPKFVRMTRMSDGDLRQPREEHAIYRIWPDFEVNALISKSISTVKADAAQKSFSAFGDGIVWAVMDTGIDRSHQHFKTYDTLKLPPPIEHRDFSGTGDPLSDKKGHGTHVAGIIAGGMRTVDAANGIIVATVGEQMGENDQHHRTFESLPEISGIAPRCKIVSLRVLDDNGAGVVSNLIAAINYVQELNGYGRRLLIHGVNMSLGYDFDPEWFACGQSPLCVEVDRLVRSGVVVVVASGNSGFTLKQDIAQNVFAAGEQLTINDPGNADLAITVGSTHRDMPHTYGVSYFSSKGPTGDGRLKPDLLAPGEKILSCAAASKLPSQQEIDDFARADRRAASARRPPRRRRPTAHCRRSDPLPRSASTARRRRRRRSPVRRWVSRRDCRAAS
jgi:serine protease AprX